MKRVIEITVAPDGQTKVETKGFIGNACRLASEFIEKALGKRLGEQLTSEFHQGVKQQQSARQGE